LSLTVSSATGRAATRPRVTTWAEHLALAVVAFIPQLLSRPGVVVGDTKSYLYLDPSRYLRQSTSLWDPTVGLGTLTHQQIGYLYPMGAFYWVVHVLHVPLWVGQRLWVGALLFGAGTGVLFLCRTIGLDGPGRFVASFAFMLTPYFLQYAGRISALLLPWAGLGWLLALVIRAVRTGGWRYPALVALVWLTVSGISASGALYVAVAPTLWLLYAVLIAKEHTWRQVWSAAWRVFILTVFVSVWWVVPLLVESKFGIDVLNYTESVPTVAQTSLASEVLRGLGSWFFYGSDGLGQWAGTSVGFARDIWLLVASFAVPTLAMGAAVVVRWRHRAFFVLTLVVAMVLAVGPHPYLTPSVIGGLLKIVMTRTSLGLAARSTDRATPAVVLSLAMLLGAGVTALTRRVRVAGLVSAVLALGVVAAANPPVWNGTTVLDRYTEPASPPGYVLAAAKALDSEHTDSGVLAIPQNAFGIGSPYRYGTLTDSIWPGVLSRPFVQGGQVPLGTLAGFDLLYGLDNPMQNQTENPAAIAPLARLMGAGDVLVQNDIQYELYNQVQPRALRALLDPTPTGLGPPKDYGAPHPSVPVIPVVDASVLATSPDVSWPSPVQVMSVANPRSVVRGESSTGAVIVDGDGEGVNAAAGLGLLDTRAPVLYAATLDTHPGTLAAADRGGATLVVTDTNRKRSFGYEALSQTGPTLGAAAPQPVNNLDIFGKKVTPGSQTTSSITGVQSVSALPTKASNAPVMAIDGLPDTAWETTPGALPHGDWWQVTLNQPITTNHITIVQAQPGDYQYDRWITKVQLTFDGQPGEHVKLGPASHTSSGQRISFSSRTFTTLRITIGGATLGNAGSKVIAASSPVGLSEVKIGNVRADQTINMPRDLLSDAGTASKSQPLDLVMTRERSAITTPQLDPEPILARAFTLPTARRFTLSGTARVDPSVADNTVDTVVGRPGPANGVVAYSSSRLIGDIRDTASAALDGNPSTMWSPGFGAPSQVGAWIQVNLPRSTAVNHLDLQIVADGYHSVPTALRVTSCAHLGTDSRCPSSGSQTRDVTLPPIADGRRQNTTVGVPVSFAALTGRYFTFTVTGARLETTKNPTPIALPLGIAELGIPGVEVAPAPAGMPDPCRSDLLSIDGHPVSIRVTGSTQAALAGQGLAVQPCGPDAVGITLGPGRHVVKSTDGAATGIGVDQLMLASAPVATAPPSVPVVHVTSSTTTSFQVRITGATKPFWLVLGESLNNGWEATVAGHATTLGTPTLIDGFANGWLVDPATFAGSSHSGGSAKAQTLSVTLRWAPQSTVTEALVVSAAAVVLCLGLVLWPRRRRVAHGRRSRAMASAGATVVDAPASRDSTSGDEDLVPVLVNPFAPAPVLPIGEALVVALITGLATATILPKAPIGFLVALVALVALVLPRGRSGFAVLVPGLCAVAAAYVVVEQATKHFTAAGWTNHFEAASVAVWTALALLAADVVAELVRRPRR